MDEKAAEDGLSPLYIELEAVLRGGGAASDGLAHEIARDLVFRREMVAHAARESRGGSGVALSWGSWGLLGALVVGAAAVGLWRSALACVAFAAAMIGCIGVVAWAVLRRRGERGRWQDVLCVRCGYDLSRLPDAVPHHTLAGQRIGPMACPECGMRWPRVERVG